MKADVPNPRRQGRGSSRPNVARANKEAREIDVLRKQRAKLSLRIATKEKRLSGALDSVAMEEAAKGNPDKQGPGNMVGSLEIEPLEALSRPKGGA